MERPHSNSIENIAWASAYRADSQPSPKASQQPGGHTAVTPVLPEDVGPPVLVECVLV